MKNNKIIKFVLKHIVAITACVLVIAFSVGFWVLSAIPTATSIGDNIIVTGKVGIGTTSPETPLHIIGLTGGDVRMEGPDANDVSFILRHTGAEGWQFGMWGNQNDLIFRLGWNASGTWVADEKMRITTAGNVGIGIAPTYRLQLPNIASAAGGGLANAWPTYSSIRWKENINLIDSDEALNKIMQLNPVHFNWKEEYGGKNDTGFIAEEIGKVIPEAVEWNGEYADALSTNQIIAYLTKVVQEQQKRIEVLEAKLNIGQ